MAASALLALSCEAASQVRESKFAMTRALNNPLSRPNITASQALSQHSGKVWVSSRNILNNSKVFLHLPVKQQNLFNPFFFFWDWYKHNEIYYVLYNTPHC